MSLLATVLAGRSSGARTHLKVGALLAISVVQTAILLAIAVIRLHFDAMIRGGRCGMANGRARKIANA